MKLHVLLGGLVVSGGLATAASAQATPENVAATPKPPRQAAGAGGSHGRGIEEVVVTAERRSARVQDVPIAITALGAKQLKAQGVSDVFDLGKIRPSFNSSETGGFSTPFMRGIGSVNVTAGDEPSVATYVDGFYQGLGIAAKLPYNNIDRIEVLKGPQGTLYGRNADGGLVSIITRTPQSTPYVEGSVGYGNYNTATFNGYATGALVDRVKADLALTLQNQQDGYSKDLLTGKSVGKDSYDGFRSKVLIDLAEGDTLLLGASYADSRDNRGNAVEPLPGSQPLAMGAGVIVLDQPFQYAGTVNPSFEVKQIDLNSTLKIDAGFANLSL